MYITNEEIYSVYKVCNEVFVQNPHLHHYIFSIGVGSRNMRGEVQEFKRIVFQTLTGERQYSSDWPVPYNTESNRNQYTIRFEKFTHLTLPRMFKDQYYYDGEDVNHELAMFKILTPYKLFVENGSLESMGLRVFKNVKTRGPLISFDHVRQLIQRDHRSIYRNVTEFYYVGQKNILLAMALTDCTLSVRLQTLVNILKYNSLEVTVQVIKSLFTAYDKLNDVFKRMNIRDAENRMHPVVVNKVYSAMLRDKSIAPLDYNSQIQNDLFKKRIVSITKRTISSCLRDTSFSVNDAYSYSRILNTIINERKSREAQLIRKAFLQGMQFGLKIEMIGWHPIKDPKFITDQRRDDVSSFWWMKEVNIIPDSFIWQEQRYLIPEKYRKWKITKLYVNQEGAMYCEYVGEEPPNVNSGKVCKGDLHIDFKSTTSNLKEMLTNAEKLLEIINYDSPHHGQDREKLVTVSKKLDLLSERNEDRKKKSKSSNTITAINLDGDSLDLTGSEPSEEETPTVRQENQIIHDEQGRTVGIAVVEDTGQPVSEDNDEPNLNVDDPILRRAINDQIINTANTDPETTAVTTNFEFEQAAEWIRSDGTTQPVVRIATNNRNVVTPTQQSNQNQIPSLGDGNLLR